MLKSIGMGVLLVTCVGCAAEPASDAGEGVAQDDVVGLGDLGTLEQTLGLVPGGSPATDGALRAGSCYRALVEGRSGHEFRRYTNGAAYFAKKDSGYNSGDARPVVCVDLFQGQSEARSLSGVVLDAIFRYDLGPFTRSDVLGSDGGRAKFMWTFQHGEMMFERMTDEEQADSVRKRPHELDLATAPSVAGRLLSLRISSLEISYYQSAATTTDAVRVSGATAFLAYRFAHRSGEQTQVFDFATDPVGAFQQKAKKFGDGGMALTSLPFAGGRLDEGRDSGGGTVEDRISWNAPSAEPNRPPLAECTREYPVNTVPPAYRCTGL